MKWITKEHQSLLDALVALSNHHSKTAVRSWIKEGRILLEGKVVTDSRTPVMPNVTIELCKKRQFLPGGIEVLYQDAHLLVIYKPAGLLSVPTYFDPEHNVHEYLRHHFRRRSIYPMHRLDREVSGVLAFAFSERVHDLIKKQFEEHTIVREYIALVEGTPPSAKGHWESYLWEDAAYRVHSSTDSSKGRLSTTRYEVIFSKKDYSVLKIMLESGRKNQIRVHASEARCPIFGDVKYGSTRSFHQRIALQAYKLGFSHPVTHQSIVCTRELDSEFFRYVPSLDLYKKM